MGQDVTVTVSQAALERYAVRLRRQRIRYTIVVSLVVIAASVTAALIWLNGEISHTTLHTVAKPPADVALTSPSAAQHELWSTTDQAALGTPYDGGSVVTFDAHTVRGRDGRTGAQTWYYTRTDRTVCTAMQVNGVTVAVYRLNGNCDEVTALDSGTGRREWTRTLDLDTHQLNGVPQFGISGTTVMFVSPAAIYAINTTDGYSGWIFAETGCTVSHAVLGTTGALISQTCAHRSCAGLKHCLNGPQLVLRDPTTGQNTDSSKNNGNPDQITWAIPNLTGLVPASVGAVVSAYAADGSGLRVLGSKDGKTAATLPLVGTSTTFTTSTDTPVSDGEVLYLSGKTYAISAGTPAAVVWSADSEVAPTVTSGAIAIIPALAQATLTIGGGPNGIEQLGANTGTATKTFSATPAVSRTARVYPYGSGFLVAGSSVTVYT